MNREQRSLLEVTPGDDSVTFDEPWQADAFALTVRLHEQGLFSWQEWTEALGVEIRRAQASGDLDLGDTYFEHWTRALIRILAAKDALSLTEIAECTEAWHQAYLRTPHGQPVRLEVSD